MTSMGAHVQNPMDFPRSLRGHPFILVGKGLMGALILVVEEDECLLEEVCAGMELAGHQSLPAQSGREAFVLLSRLRPDAILIDLLMAEGGAWGFLGEKAKVPELAMIPAFVMSGLRVVGDEEEEDSEGMDFRPMRVRLEDLMRQVEKQLQLTKELAVLKRGESANGPPS